MAVRHLHKLAIVKGPLGLGVGVASEAESCNESGSDLRRGSQRASATKMLSQVEGQPACLSFQRHQHGWRPSKPHDSPHGGIPPRKQAGCGLRQSRPCCNAGKVWSRQHGLQAMAQPANLRSCTCSLHARSRCQLAETRHRRETQRLAWAAKKAMYVKRPAREVIDQPDVRTTNTSACPLTDTCSQREGCMSAAEAPGSMYSAEACIAEHWGLGSQHAAGCLMTPSAEQGNMLTGQEAEMCHSCKGVCM